MAILSDAPGIEAKIYIDGQAAIEYPCPEDEDESQSREVVNYIEAKSGAYFSIKGCVRWSEIHGPHGLKADYDLDGKPASSIAYQRHGKEKAFEESGSRSTQDKQVYLQRFQFSHLVTGKSLP
jgi:hypothetical protein